MLGKKTIGTIAYMGGTYALPPQFTWSWGQMIQFNMEYLCNQGEIIHQDKVDFSFHSAARNFLTNRILGDWLCMFDTDHAFEPDILARMVNFMNVHEVDVITAKYRHKSPPYTPVIYKRNENDALEIIVGWDNKLSLVEVDSAGAGCLLVKKEVYKRIREELHEEPFDIMHPYSEDHSFFMRLRKLEIKAWCAVNIDCYHLKTQEIDDSNYQEQTSVTKYMVQGVI